MKPALQRGSSNYNNWNPTDTEIDEGRDYIMRGCPVDETDSDMTVWICKKIKPDSESPIAGWPEMKVRRIADNKKKAAQGVPVMKSTRNCSLNVCILCEEHTREDPFRQHVLCL